MQANPDPFTSRQAGIRFFNSLPQKIEDVIKELAGDESTVVRISDNYAVLYFPETDVSNNSLEESLESIELLYNRTSYGIEIEDISGLENEKVVEFEIIEMNTRRRNHH